MLFKLIKQSSEGRKFALAEGLLRGGSCGETTLLGCVVGEAVYSLAKFLLFIAMFSFFLGVFCSVVGVSLQAFFQDAIGDRMPEVTRVKRLGVDFFAGLEMSE
jgi:hypothetical protein